MTRRGNVEKIILDFAKAVCEGERTMIDEKKVELMKKLQRLAERGVGGEKEGTQKKLQQLMKKYDIDPCANEQNHKCEKYFTKEDNGLSKDWGGIACFAILRMVERLQTGLKRHTEKGQKTTRLLLC